MSDSGGAKKRRWWLLAPVASIVLLLVLGWQWGSEEHTCQDCGATKTVETGSLVFWRVYSSTRGEPGSTAGDHDHDWKLEGSTTISGPFSWFSK